MGTLEFALHFKSLELSSLDLPVEIRKPDSTLVRTVLASEKVTSLPAGRYYASARLPGGQRLVTPFELRDAPVTVPLAPDPEDESAHEWEEVAHFLGRPPKPAPVPTKAATAVPPRPRHMEAVAGTAPALRHVPKLRLFAGNVIRKPEPLDAPLSALYERHSESEYGRRSESEFGRLVQFGVFGGARLLLAQLVEPGGPVQNVALPISPIGELTLVVVRRPDGTYRLEPHLQHTVADMLLQYGAAGAASSARQVAQSVTLDGERLLQSKMADPVAAVVGAYSILRVGELAQLRDWTRNLYRSFEWLPDGAAIYGEHLARVGRHKEAAEAFCEIPDRGLPLFADGVFYAVERLTLYTSRRGKGTESIDVSRAGAALEELERFAGLLRRQRPVSTYPGLDPQRPDTTAAPADFADPACIDLAEWFGPMTP